jgi:hypothetical protein
MASTLDPFIRVVMNMMRQFGGDGQLVVTSTGEYDPASGKTPKVTQKIPARVIVLDYMQKIEGVGNKTGTMIQDGDKQAFMQPSADVPTPRPEIDKIIYKGVPHSIVSFKELNPTGTKAILYELFIRQ